MMNYLWVDIHTHQQKFRSETISIFNLSTNDSGDDKKRVSIGIHPWRIQEENWLNQFQYVIENAKNSNVKFIGETGIDKLKGPSLDIQKKIFEAHVELALELDKPLIIHCVKAQNEIIAILKGKNFDLPVIFHGFDKKLSAAKEVIKNGFSISLGKSLFSKPELSKEVLQLIPHSNIFFETDDSNHSIQEMYAQAALISGQTLLYWQKIIFSNYQNLGNE